MGHKIGAKYGIKVSWLDRDALISLAGCEIVLKLMAGFGI